MTEATVSPVPGRSCGECTLCCKILAIPEIAKPRHQWCPHCKVGAGCTVYEMRPTTCRAFFCGYLLDAKLGEHWKPSRARMLLTWESHANRLVIHVDPGRPDAWRKPPYYAEIKAWAARAARARGQVILWQGKDVVAILPDRDKVLGPMKDGQFIVTTEKRVPGGVELDVRIVDAEDPLAAGLHRR